MNPLSGVLTEAWDLYRRYALHFLSIAFVIFLVAAIIWALLAEFAGATGYGIGGIISEIAMFLVQAALVTAVQDVRDGRVDLDFGQTVSAALPFLLPVAVASILAAIGIGIGIILLIVPGLILLTFWSLIVPAIVIGRAGPIEAFGRSWRTVRGHAWQVFGTYVLVFLIWVAAGFILAIVLGVILAGIPLFARNFISNIVSSTLVTPFLALVVTLIYYRLAAAQPATAGPGWSPQPPPPPPAGGGFTQPPPAQPPAGGFTPPPPPPAAQPPGEGFTPPPPPPAQPPSEGFTQPAGPPAAGSTQPYPAATPPAGDAPQPPPAQPASEGFTQPSPEPEEGSPRPPAAPPPEDSGA